MIGSLDVLGYLAASIEEMALHAVTGTFPEQASSEGVLQMLETQKMTGKRVLRVRGKGGREMLATTLRQRGAQVDYFEVYRRKKHPWTHAQLVQLLSEEQIQVVMLTSGEALEYFSELLGRGDERLTLLLPSARLVNLARQLGFDRIRLTEGAGNQAMASGLSSWMAH